jgi:hypothetical protein
MQRALLISEFREHPSVLTGSKTPPAQRRRRLKGVGFLTKITRDAMYEGIELNHTT